MYIGKIQRLVLTHKAETILTKREYDIAKALCESKTWVAIGNMEAAAHINFCNMLEILKGMLRDRLVYYFDSDKVVECFKFEIDYTEIPESGIFYLPGTFIKGAACEL